MKFELTTSNFPTQALAIRLSAQPTERDLAHMRGLQEVRQTAKREPIADIPAWMKKVTSRRKTLRDGVGFVLGATAAGSLLAACDTSSPTSEQQTPELPTKLTYNQLFRSQNNLPGQYYLQGKPVTIVADPGADFFLGYDKEREADYTEKSPLGDIQHKNQKVGSGVLQEQVVINGQDNVENVNFIAADGSPALQAIQAHNKQKVMNVSGTFVDVTSLDGVALDPSQNLVFQVADVTFLQTS